MKLKWYGHACFELISSKGNILFDPYSPGKVPGLELPRLTADMVLCSHGHADHVNTVAITESGRECGFSVEKLHSFHDAERGRLRGENLISVVSGENRRIAHLGDLGHEPTGEQYEKLANLDILMIPVGGFYTIDAAMAKRIADRLAPAHIVPMHYRKGEKGLQNIGELEAFLNEYAAEDISYLNSSLYDLDSDCGKKVLVFPWPGEEMNR